MRACILGILLAWAVQVVLIGYHLAEFSLREYWWLRRVYRPGLALFAALFDGMLPGRYFSAFSRTGAISGFLFASLLYAALAVALVVLIRRLVMRRTRACP